jgi:hypothetical protein
MEIVMIEARVFEAMMSRFEELSEKADVLCKRYDGREVKEWLDSQDVCITLGISKRTLQSLRDYGKLRYAMVGRKMYYRPKDVQAMIGCTKSGKEVENEK